MIEKNWGDVLEELEYHDWVISETEFSALGGRQKTAAQVMFQQIQGGKIQFGREKLEKLDRTTSDRMVIWTVTNQARMRTIF